MLGVGKMEEGYTLLGLACPTGHSGDGCSWLPAGDQR